jgi:hypothetical protein
MSSNIGSLPPPFPNAAISLSKVAGDAQLREAIEQSSESKPIQTGISSEDIVKSAGSSSDANAESNTSGSEDNTQSQDTGTKLDLSI